MKYEEDESKMTPEKEEEEKPKKRTRGPDKKPRTIKPGSRKGIGGTASVTKNLNARAEDVSRIVRESAQYFRRPIAKTNEEVAERLENYFTQCAETGQMPTVEDMALALGTTRGTLLDWEKNRRNPERAVMIQKAKEILAGIDAKLVSEGRIPQVTYIFRSKNYFGLRDQQEVVVTPNPMGESASPDQLRQKYLDSTYGLVEESQKVAEIAERAESPGLPDLSVVEYDKLDN